MSKQILSILLLAAGLALPFDAMSTEYVIDGIRYDCTGAGNSAKAAIKPAMASDEPYAGDIVIPETVTVAATGKTFKVTEAKMNAFANCTGLVSISLPSTMTTLGNYLFEGCSSLISVTLPSDTYSLPMGCFKDCIALESIEVGAGFGTIGGNAFEGCTALKTVDIKISGYLMGANAFKGCTSLECIVIPDNITLLGVNLFEGCTSLTDVTLPAGLTSIPDYLFKDCSSLTTFVAGEKVKSVGKGSFTGCTSLKWVEFTNTANAVTLNATVAPFDEAFMAEGIFYVPDDMVDAYKESLAGAVNVLPVSQRDAEPIVEWESRGEATFFDPWICSVFDVEHYSWTVEVEESTERPGYFRMKNPYLNGNCPMFADGEANDIYINACDPTMVYIETQGLGFSPNYQAAPEFFVSSVAGRHQENNIQSLEEDKAQGLTGLYKDGIITIPANAVLWSLPPYHGDDFYTCRHNFELRFSDAVIYEIGSEVLCVDEYYANYYKECVDRTETVPVFIAATENVTTIKYGVVPGVITPDSKLLASIASSENVTTAGRHDFTVPQDYVGRLTMVFVALDADGDVRAHCTSLFDVINDELYGPWKEKGTTRYEDVIIYSVFEAQLPAYDVVIEESLSRPGIYRLKDVYSPIGRWSSHEGNIHHHEKFSHYLYINAEDPEAVYVMPSPVGFKANDGCLLLSSPVAKMLDEGYDLDLIKSLAPDLFGQLANDKITIPSGMVYGSETNYDDGKYYVANDGFLMVVNLPKKSGIENVYVGEVGDSDDAPVFYNMQGQRINNPSHGTPVIEIRNGKALKIVR